MAKVIEKPSVGHGEAALKRSRPDHQIRSLNSLVRMRGAPARWPIAWSTGLSRRRCASADAPGSNFPSAARGVAGICAGLAAGTACRQASRNIGAQRKTAGLIDHSRAHAHDRLAFRATEFLIRIHLLCKVMQEALLATFRHIL